MVRDLLKHLTCFKMIRDGPVDLPRKDRLDNGGTAKVAEMPKDKRVSEFIATNKRSRKLTLYSLEKCTDAS